MTYPENSNIERFIAGEEPEAVLEPDLPIIDPHHHLWDNRAADSIFEQTVYLCEEIMADINKSGHNITQTVFAQCGAFFRAAGPKDMRCVGETEFVQWGCRHEPLRDLRFDATVYWDFRISRPESRHQRRTCAASPPSRVSQLSRDTHCLPI